jgi:hypothetical protein
VAQKVHVILVDDLDGGEAEETVTFSLDGASYEIDLSPGNAGKLRDVLTPYVESARKVTGRAAAGRSPRGKASRGNAANTSQIRAWAKSMGLSVNDRGRIPGSIVEQYQQSQG